jgi:DNA polymerase-4
MGVSTIGQLARIPEEYLKSVFGINGVKFAAYARGEDGLSIRDYRVVRSVSRETGFARNITDRTVLGSHFYYLLERATRKLRDLSKRAASVRIKFRYSDFQTVEGAAQINPPSNCESRIFSLVEMMFQRLFTRRVGIRLVGVTLCNLKNAIENESFIYDRAEKERRMLKAIDSVRNRAGFFSVTTGRTLSLSESYKRGDTGYELRTPGLSQ